MREKRRAFFNRDKLILQVTFRGRHGLFAFDNLTYRLLYFKGGIMSRRASARQDRKPQPP